MANRLGTTPWPPNIHLSLYLCDADEEVGSFGYHHESISD